MVAAPKAGAERPEQQGGELFPGGVCADKELKDSQTRDQTHRQLYENEQKIRRRVLIPCRTCVCVIRLSDGLAGGTDTKAESCSCSCGLV